MFDVPKLLFLSASAPPPQQCFGYMPRMAVDKDESGWAVGTLVASCKCVAKAALALSTPQKYGICIRHCTTKKCH